MTFFFITTSRYHIQSRNIRIPRSPPAAVFVRGGLGGRQAGLGALLAGGLGVGVPRPVPVGAVAYCPLIDVDALSRWDHPVPSKAVGT